ncbi:MAG: TraR/DksA C4-type zinc finger protein [Verrucomicrobiales bacterium]|nr:TraR/DksA C4-type zinc finger protein [Verrucomicrobiales bacterium]
MVARAHVISPKKAKAGSNGSKKVSRAFVKRQKTRLFALRDDLTDQMAGVARDNLRQSKDAGDSSAFGMHQADAGSDAYDRDFALNLLSQEQDALYEIDEALKRIEDGAYGVCEMSGKPIASARLEAMPFARFTVECQAQLEKESNSAGGRRLHRHAILGQEQGGAGGFGFSSTESVEGKKK